MASSPSSSSRFLGFSGPSGDFTSASSSSSSSVFLDLALVLALFPLPFPLPFPVCFVWAGGLSVFAFVCSSDEEPAALNFGGNPVPTDNGLRSMTHKPNENANV